MLKLSLLPLIIKQKQNTTKIETNAEICSGFFFCVPMFLLVKSYYGASITTASLKRSQSNYRGCEGMSLVKQDYVRALSLWTPFIHKLVVGGVIKHSIRLRINKMRPWVNWWVRLWIWSQNSWAQIPAWSLTSSLTLGTILCWFLIGETKVIYGFLHSRVIWGT